jgi:hypothetical protein
LSADVYRGIHTEGMNRSQQDSAPQLWQGLPQTPHSGLGPVGEIEQATKIAEEFRQHRQGWRRVVFVAGLVVLALMAAFMLVVAVLGPA